MRLTPALARSAKRAASALLGLASSVISTSSAAAQCPRAAVMTASTVAGGISDGVPPPKKIEVRRCSGKQRGFMREVGEQARRATSSWSTVSRTWLLKSQ